MSMSHAAAVWIPSTGHDIDTLKTILQRHNAGDHLSYDFFTRSAPEATCIVVPLDDNPDAQMDESLLEAAAADIAKTLKTRAYALYAFFGSGDWMSVTAFAATGERRWSEGDDDEPPLKRMRTTAKALGMRLSDDPEPDDDDGGYVPTVNEITFPYWRMVSELEQPLVEDMLGLGLKPAFDLDFVEGWQCAGELLADDEDEDEGEIDGRQEREAVGPVLTRLKIGDRVVDDLIGAAEVVAIETMDGLESYRLEGIDDMSEEWIPVDEVENYGLRRLKE
jgi:hypothetical protein